MAVVQSRPRHVLKRAVLHDDIQELDVKLVLDQLDALEQVLEGLQTTYVRLLLKLQLLREAVRFPSGRDALEYEDEVLQYLNPVLVYAEYVELLQGRDKRSQRRVETVQIQNRVRDAVAVGAHVVERPLALPERIVLLCVI